jgi:hypothetical protein
VKLVIYGSTFKIYSNGVLKSTVVDSQYATPGEISLQNHYGSFSRFDNVRVRKYVDPEPSHGSWGSETSTSYHNVLKIVNKVADGWKVNLKVYNSSNVGRLLSTTISLNDGTTSDQITVSSGVITQSEGALCDLGGSSTMYISMSNLQATTSGTSNLNVYFKAKMPNNGVYIQLQITFQIN